MVTGLLAALFLMSMILMSCSPATPSGPSAPPSGPAATSTPSPEPSSDEVIELRYATFLAPAAPRSPVDEEWARRIEEKSGGRIKITIYWSGSLVNYNDMLRGVGAGTADIGFLGFTPGLHHLNLVTNLPFIGATSMENGTQLYHDLYDKFPELQEEHANFNLKPIFSYALPGINLHTTKKQVNSVADMKGMKLYASPMWTAAMDSMQAALVNMAPPEFYTSLDRGLIEGICDTWLGLESWKVMDLVKHHTVFGDSGVSMMVMYGAMNLDTWNSLPPDIQQIFMEMAPYSENEAIKINQDTIDWVLANADEKGDTYKVLTEEEIAKDWEPRFQSYIDKWITETEELGWPAQEVYDEAKRLAKEYAK